MGNESSVPNDNSDIDKKLQEQPTKDDRSKWQVVDTPQDASFLPTLAVALWLGWMGVLVKVSLLVFCFGSPLVKVLWIGLCTLSWFLPPNFPSPMGKDVFGKWLMLQAEKYFGLKTTVEDPDSLKEASKGSALIFAKEPHDVLPYSVFCFADALQRVCLHDPQQSIAALTTGAIFQIPFIKQVYSWVGCFPVDKKTFRRRLDRKESFAFIPGGAQEVLKLASSNGKIPLYLQKRKGFVKLALQTGSPIVPVFAFGLDQSYDYIISPFTATLSRQMGFVPVLFTGRFGIPFGIPKATKIHVVIGKPILIPKLEEEDSSKMAEAIDKYHAIYLQELEALFERHKQDEKGYESKHLMIF